MTAVKSDQAMKIWVDLDNSPHVPFFFPIIEELRSRGFDVCITARDCFQTCELADLYRMNYRSIGHHYGKHRIMKATGLIIRSMQLLPTIIKERPQLAISHGSRSQMMAASVAGIKTVLLSDYEYASDLFTPTFFIVPEAIPDDIYKVSSQRVFHYPGLKEDVYAHNFRPDPSIRKSIGVADDDIVVLTRPPADKAHYHNPEAEILYDALVDHVAAQSETRLVVLPRDKSQADYARQKWPELFRTRKIIIPDKVYNGLDLIWHSDLVVSGGGTMNREAAALNVPVYSIFRGKIGAVDRYLSDNGRLVLLSSVDEVRNKIKMQRRKKLFESGHSSSAALNQIVSHLMAIIKGIQTQKVHAEI